MKNSPSASFLFIMFGSCSCSKSDIPTALSIVELLVQMDCRGCEKRVRRAIYKIDGVDSVEVDMDQQKVTVTGYVDRWQVLKAATRAVRKAAEFWPYPYDGDCYPYTARRLDDSTFEPTYNCCHNGSGENIHSYFPHCAYPTVTDEALYLFNDDNVHACSIM